MHQVSDVYKEIVSGDYSAETKLIVGNLTYGEDKIMSLSTSHKLFKGSTPAVGGCVAGELDCTLIANTNDIPSMAKIIPMVRVTNGTSTSEWIQKGVFYCDTRDVNPKMGQVSIHAYDMMMALEEKYDATSKKTDSACVEYILDKIDVELSEELTSEGYTIPVPDSATSMREIMGNIAAAYAGNWIIDDFGKMKLICLNELPAETFYLVSYAGDAITYGGDRIVIS